MKGVRVFRKMSLRIGIEPGMTIIFVDVAGIAVRIGLKHKLPLVPRLSSFI